MKTALRIKDLLKDSILKLKKAGLPSPELDVRVILEFALGISTEDFYRVEVSISARALTRIDRLISRRINGEPVAYLTGHKEFFGLDFKVNKNVLIPRPETEELVIRSIKFIKSLKPTRKINIIDIGTGSGCIIISIIKSLCGHPTLQTLNFYASDISENALKVARKNAKTHQIDHIKFIHSDLFKNRVLHRKFDVIAANLPYVPEASRDRSVKFEPRKAIFASKNGASIIERFLKEARYHIAKNGIIILELDPRNSRQIKSCAKGLYPGATLILQKDLSSFDRYLLILK